MTSHSVPKPRLGLFASLGFVLLTLVVGCGGGSSSTPPPVERVAQQIARAGAASVIVFVSDDGREYVATAGTRRPNADKRFRIGSVTKTFTATIALQLVAEGRLRLGDTLERYLPGVVPKGDKITVRQLLNHRSGLWNITDHTLWLERARRSPSTRPIDTLRFAASHPLTFPPGSQWRYSNTNYIALGLVIEKTTGRRTGKSSRSASSSRSDSIARCCRLPGCCRISMTRGRIPILHGRRAPWSRTRTTSPASSPRSSPAGSSPRIPSPR
jgi:D-alanyl-D-alanine carboxypeptidase